jgi:hypothetical protein
VETCEGQGLWLARRGRPWLRRRREQLKNTVEAVAVFSLEMKGEVAGRLVFDRGQGGHSWPLVLGEPSEGDCEGRHAGEVGLWGLRVCVDGRLWEEMAPGNGCGEEKRGLSRLSFAKGREKLWLARGEKVCVAFWESPRRGRRAL